MQSESKALQHRIPWLMAATRATLGPVMILGERAGWSGTTLAVIVVTALLSDIFDGVLARRWTCDTAAVRLFDSMADIVFYISCAIALWMRHPSILRGLAAPIAAVLGLELLCLAVSFVKFGKLPSYHSYLAKIWGLVLASALVAAFVAKHPVGWIAAALALGALSNLEGLTMSLILPEWRHDLKTLRRALEVRKQIRRDRETAVRQRAPLSQSARAAGALTLLVLAFAGTSARASSIPSVSFIGGSTPGITTGTIGTLETGPDNITFQSNGGSLAIPYTQIQNFSYREQAVNLGILPIIVFSLFRPEIHRHIVSISYLDSSGQKQVAIFEVPKQAKNTLPVVLQERTSVCSDQYQLPCRTGLADRNSHRVIVQERLP